MPQPTCELLSGGRGRPFAASMLETARYGYAEAEYALAGTATRYRLATGAELTRDGHWRAEPAGTAPFRTRLLIYRPTDPAHFNGTVVLTWNNVSAGYDLFSAESLELLEGGFGLACLTTQKVGIVGLPPEPTGLAAWDPARYGKLTIPSDDYSYDIFTQGARAVGPNRSKQPVDPMAGLEVKRVVALGASQSAGRLATYLNAVQPLERALDGFILGIYFGTGSALEVGDAVVNLNLLKPGQRLHGSHLLRDDLGVPVFVVNSELEAIACYPVRQRDTDTFRYWESAGTCHVSDQVTRERQKKLQRDGVKAPPLFEGINRIPIVPLYEAAFHHMQRWLTAGTPPPIQPKLEFAGDPPQPVRDTHGIAQGGIRLPQVEVPIATNSAIPRAPDIFSYLRGSCSPFSSDQLRELYGDKVAFLTEFESAAKRAVEAGVLLPRDAAALVAEAADSWPR
ncbi:MAG TPA: alpha/beta hydrolase domain-containing protein [Myxococcota bacterium]|nr:alpha/beta hydrolase domain-containing protein [Myxococcota bacterium]